MALSNMYSYIGDTTLAASLTNSPQVAYPQSSVLVMESSRIPFLEELQLFWKGSVIRKPNGRRDSSDLSAQRIQFNKLTKRWNRRKKRAAQRQSRWAALNASGMLLGALRTVTLAI